MTTTVTILGCGSSSGVPRFGGDWGQCDPANPKNRRRRCSILVEKKSTNGSTCVLIDTSPDMRDQLLSAGVQNIDAVLYTHEHADHTHGIDDLRGVFLKNRRKVPVWADETTGQMLMTRFGYCFYTAPGSDYPSILALNRMVVGKVVETGGAGGIITALPIRLHHGNIEALGFRIGSMAYTPDVNGIPDESIPTLEGLDLWVVDGLKRTAHPSHFSLPETLVWIDRLKPKRAVITNMHIDLDFNTLRSELPPNVEPAYDGMTLTIG